MDKIIEVIVELVVRLSLDKVAFQLAFFFYGLIGMFWHPLFFMYELDAVHHVTTIPPTVYVLQITEAIYPGWLENCGAKICMLQ